MTEFVVTDPSGKEFVINAPEGATQEQALEYAKGQFGSTPGGAAVGNPQLARQGAVAARQPGSMEGLQAIGGSGVMGTIFGAGSPEILRGAGRALGGVYPTLRPLGLALEQTGNLLSTQRGKAAFQGGVGGVASESAGQLAEAQGVGKIGSETARIAGGFAGPEAMVLGKSLLETFVKKPALSFMSHIRKQTAKTLLEKIESNPESLTDAENKEFARLVADLHGSEKPGAPAGDVFGGLEQGATKARTDAAAEAKTALDAADKEANRTVFETLKGPVADRRAASAKLAQIGDTALETAQKQRLAIGNDSELTDVGTGLRGAITAKNEQAIAAREAQLKQDAAQRDYIVSQKEKSGLYINQTPEFKNIVTSLRSELQKGKHSPEVRKSYEDILRELESGGTTKVYSAQAPQFVSEQQAPIKFQVVEEVRRNLGQVFRGTPAEGFKAIDENIARKVYDQLRDLQIKYAGGVGGPQERLLANYAQKSEELKQFASKTGKKATAVDKIDMDLFTTDPSALPKHYFGSRTEVQNLLDLVGDKKLVSEAARDFVTNQLRGKNEAGVRSWMTANRDALSHPAMLEAKLAADNYANALQKGETIARRAKDRIAATSTEADDFLKIALSRAEGIRKTGQQHAGAATDAGERLATTALGSSGEPSLVRANATSRVRNLIESGSPEQWTVAGDAIRSHPKAQAAMFDAVRQVIADRAEKSPTTVAAFFTDKVKPMVEAAGVLTPTQTQEISGKLAQIARMQVPEQAKLGHMQRMILETLSSYASSIEGRAVETTSRIAREK